MKTALRSVFILFTLFFVVSALSACQAPPPKNSESGESTPQADGPQTEDPVEPEPERTDYVPPADTGDTLKDTVINFYDAMASHRFAAASTFCTDEFFESEFGDMVEYFSDYSDEEQAELLRDFRLIGETLEQIQDAISEYTSDTATWILADEEGVTGTFDFEKVGDKWKLSGFD